MTVYVLAQLSFTDEPRYRKYQSDFGAVFQGSGGRVLSADEAPELLEGDWFGDKVVLMEFPDRAQALGFLESPAYRQISEDRRAGADTVALMVEGMPEASLSAP